MQKVTKRPSLIDTFKLLISSSLKGFSQVMLVDNAISGSLILLGIILHSPLLGLMAFVSSFIGTVIGKYFGDVDTVRKGIYGFNSLLTGVAVMLFLTNELRWTIVFIAAAAAALLKVVLLDTFNIKKVPLLTVPFVLVTWTGLLFAYSIELLNINATFVITSPSKWNLLSEGTTPNMISGLVKGIGEVFLIDNFWTGSLIFLALLWAGWRYGVYAMAGSLLSWLTAYSIGVDTELLDLGLYNYNAVLTMIAVGLMFDEKKRKFPLTGIIAAIMTVPVAAGMDMLLAPIGLPALTSPFIVTTWMFLIVRKFIKTKR
jgi:urea transporter